MKSLSTELLVAGGGIAGCCAAIAAARSGVRTLLAERRGYLGGTAVGGMLHQICGLYLDSVSLPDDVLNDGLTAEIVRRLSERSPDTCVQQIGQVYVLPYSTHDLKLTLDDLFAAEAGLLTVVFDSEVTAATVGDGRIRQISLETPDGVQIIDVAAAVDCTGDGNLSVLAGAQYEQYSGDQRQLAGFTLQVRGLGADDLLAIKVPYQCRQAVQSGLFPAEIRFTSFTQGTHHGEGYLKLSVTEEDTEDRDRLVLERAHALFRYLQETIGAFASACITDWSRTVFEREGRRILGDYQLTEQDVLGARKFPDGIVRNGWPIELWDRSRGTVYQYVPTGEYYEIPFRCLRVPGVDNLLTAGRCISVTHQALGSTRVMGACMALGEQAGRAAAQYIRCGAYPEITREV